MASSRVSRTKALLACILVGGGAFLWGAACGRYEVFPFRLLRSALGRTGSISENGTESNTAAEPPPGLWGRATGDEFAGLDMDAMRELADLPYLEGYQEAPEESSVTRFDPDRAEAGLNLVVSGHAPAADLVDMEGRVLHAWSLQLRAAWPALDLDGREGFAEFWRRAHAFPDGDLLAIYDGIGMVRVDADSRLEWADAGNYHHDLWVADDGTIYTLSRHSRDRHDVLELDGPIEEDFVSILAPTGDELRRVSVLECFVRSDYFPLLENARKQGDVLHANTIERLDGRFADRIPAFAEGNFLVSLPTINTVAVVDIDRVTVTWALAGLWKFQHQPTLLESGHLLVFDNGGEWGDSRVLELDPLTHDVAWSYRSTPKQRFSSPFLGSSARLPGGNTLVTESTAGRAFEVTPQGERVWEYLNPHRAGEGDRLIASLLEVVRLAPDYFAGEFADRLAASRALTGSGGE